MSVGEEIKNLEAAIREAHTLLKDLRAATKDAKDAIVQVRAVARSVFEEEMAAQVDAGLKSYAEGIGKSIDEATEAVFHRFDTIANTLLGEGKRARKQGQTALRDLIEEKIAREGSAL